MKKIATILVIGVLVLWGMPLHSAPVPPTAKAARTVYALHAGVWMALDGGGGCWEENGAKDAPLVWAFSSVENAVEYFKGLDKRRFTPYPSSCIRAYVLSITLDDPKADRVVKWEYKSEPIK